MSAVENLLSYSRQTNRMAHSTHSAWRPSVGVSPNAKSARRSFTFSFRTANADFFPIPEKLPTESHPVIQRKTGRILSTVEPNTYAVSWIATYLLLLPTPVLNQNLLNDDKFVAN